MVQLSSTQALLGAMRRAHRISLASYTIGRGPVLDALLQAAHRGAVVRVRLEGFLYSGSEIQRENAEAAALLAKAGADVALVHRSADATDPMLHLKGAAIDNAAFLDDRNWRAAPDDTIVRSTSRSEVRMIKDAVNGNGDDALPSLAVRKRDALDSEAEVIRSARHGDRVLVESESFGSSNAVYSAIERAIARGAHVDVLLSSRDVVRNPRERAAIARLKSEGVRVKESGTGEKFAVAGTRAWIGSANASAAFSHPDQLDWGACSRSGALLAHLRRAFARAWRPR